MANEEPDVLRSAWSHRTWVFVGCTAVLVSLQKCITAASHSNSYFKPLFAAFIGYLIADLLSGIYHWVIDNYGSASTPFVGSQIDAFQWHHRAPSGIRKVEFAYNLFPLGRFVTLVLVPINTASDSAVVHGFTSMCFGCILFSQQFHKWAHITKPHLPRIVVALQDAGVLLSCTEHAMHHRQPNNRNYCIVSGVCNPILDGLGVFGVMEMVLFRIFGVKPRSWSTPVD